MFSFHLQHIFCLCLAVRSIYTCSSTIFLTESQNNVLLHWKGGYIDIFCISRIGVKENMA